MSFYRDGILEKSTYLDVPGVCHGFSTRHGGVSTTAHTASMNVAEGRGDDAATVRQNIDILARAVSGGSMGAAHVVCAPQLHSTRIRRVTAAEGGSGVLTPPGESGDGFVSTEPGVLLMIRMADCVPILFCASRTGERADAIAAVHAGWRGTALGIAPEAMGQLLSLGVRADSIRVAVGQSIHACCYEVGEDFRDAVRALRGVAFTDRFVTEREGRLRADLPAMNRHLLLESGLSESQIELSPRCTACAPHEFHSHRATRGVRGTMGALIGLKKAGT